MTAISDSDNRKAEMRAKIVESIRATEAGQRADAILGCQFRRCKEADERTPEKNQRLYQQTSGDNQ